MKYEYSCHTCGAIVSVIAPREVCPVCDAATLRPSALLPPQDEMQWTQFPCRRCGQTFAIRYALGVFACPICQQTYQVVELEPLYVVRYMEEEHMDYSAYQEEEE